MVKAGSIPFRRMPDMVKAGSVRLEEWLTWFSTFGRMTDMVKAGSVPLEERLTW